MPLPTENPAKFSRALIQRIYQHAKDEGWVSPGSVILDPFGGVALGAHDAALAGYPHVSVELESRFVDLAQQNIDLWQRRYGHLPQWVRPVVVQGDSRFLAQVLGQADVCLSSPPYGDGQVGTGKKGRTGWRGYTDHGGGTSATPGQLAAMPAGSVDCAVSSPPYADGCVHDTGQETTKTRQGSGTLKRPWGTRKDGESLTAYGTTPGNLGHMVPGQVADVCVSSMPWEGSLASGHLSQECLEDLRTKGHKPSASGESASYGAHPDQLGNTQGTTFWESAKVILQQVFNVLKPNGVAIWVVKDYVRDGQIVPFSQQWKMLAEAVGFVTLHEHHALLVEEHGTQGSFLRHEGPARTEAEPEDPEADPWGPIVDESRYHVEPSFADVSTKRASFFRRLAERKRPDLAINAEIVYCMRKPAETAGGEIDCACSSPPFLHTDGGCRPARDLAGVINKALQTRHAATSPVSYGDTPGQLGTMPPGSVDLALSSPPYAASAIGACEGNMSGGPGGRKASALTDVNGNIKAVGYGTTDGQLGSMPAGIPPTQEPTP